MHGGAAEESLFSRLLELIARWLVDLDLNSGLFVEIMNDEELPATARLTATGVLLYLTASRKLIQKGLKLGKYLALISDVLVMSIGLSIITPLMPEARLDYYQRKYRAVAGIHEAEEILKAALGILWQRMVRFVENLRQRRYRKATTEEVLASPALREQLFDDAMEWVADQDLDPATLNERLKELPPPESVIGLLANGLEEEQEREDADDGGPKIRLPWRLAQPDAAEDEEGEA
jgi:hypothetical protein